MSLIDSRFLGNTLAENGFFKNFIYAVKIEFRTFPDVKRNSKPLILFCLLIKSTYI